MKLDLKGLYKQKIVPSLIEEFGYKNIEQVPKIVKISVNRGIGEASKNSKELDASVQEMTLIVGQQPTVNKSKKICCRF
jgi:large subunit ribosomal protein L5